MLNAQGNWCVGQKRVVACLLLLVEGGGAVVEGGLFVWWGEVGGRERHMKPVTGHEQLCNKRENG